jgi:hypothetical protein
MRLESKVCPLLALLLLSFSGPQDEYLLKDSDHKKMGKEIAECLTAKNEGKGQIKAEEDLKEALDKWEKKKPFKERDPLSGVRDLGASLWYSNAYDKKKVSKGKVDSLSAYAGARFDSDIEYCVWAPSKYKASAGPYALVLCLPDSGQRAFDHLTEDWALGAMRDEVVFAAIDMPEDVSAWSELGEPGAPGGIVNLMTVFREMTRNYAVDFDKVFLAGKGAGVSAALELAGVFPDRFAGVIGRAGDAGEASHANYRNLPVLFAGGGQKATGFAEAMESEGFADSLVQPDAKEQDVFSWIKSTSRDAMPKAVTFSPAETFAPNAYWLGLPVTEPVEGRVIKASLDTSLNQIIIEAKHVSSVTIYFNDLMVDMDRPVTVICNGVKNEDLIPRNFSTMMRAIYSGKSDAGRVFTASREYDIPKIVDDEVDEG